MNTTEQWSTCEHTFAFQLVENGKKYDGFALITLNETGVL
jgi:hypothetical protein